MKRKKYFVIDEQGGFDEDAIYGEYETLEDSKEILYNLWIDCSEPNENETDEEFYMRREKQIEEKDEHAVDRAMSGIGYFLAQGEKESILQWLKEEKENINN